MIGRSNDRGLGTLTWEAARHLEPAKVLVVVRDPPDHHDASRFPGARWCREESPGRLRDRDMRWLLEGIDVLYTAETPYDYRLLERARAAGVGTALHGMWEFFAWRRQPDLPRPDLFLAPSPWHLDEWPEPTVLLPVPIATDRFSIRDGDWPAEPVVVHAAGAAARADRNGTASLMRALPMVRTPMTVIVRTQERLRVAMPRRTPVTVRVEPAVGSYWQVHEGADAAVLPRRYGGLSLPLQEATGAGLPVLALEREHDAGYAHAAWVPTLRARQMRTGAGLPIERYEVTPRQLARSIDERLGDPKAAEQMREMSRAAARALAWETLRPRYEAVLGALG